MVLGLACRNYWRLSVLRVLSGLQGIFTPRVVGRARQHSGKTCACSPLIFKHILDTCRKRARERQGHVLPYAIFCMKLYTYYLFRNSREMIPWLRFEAFLKHALVDSGVFDGKQWG